RKNNGVVGTSTRPRLSASRSSRYASTRGEKRSSLSRRRGSLDDDMAHSPADSWLVLPRRSFRILAVLLLPGRFPVLVLLVVGRLLVVLLFGRLLVVRGFLVTLLLIAWWIFLLRLFPLRFGELLQAEQLQRPLLLLGRQRVPQPHKLQRPGRGAQPVEDPLPPLPHLLRVFKQFDVGAGKLVRLLLCRLQLVGHRQQFLSQPGTNLVVNQRVSPRVLLDVQALPLPYAQRLGEVPPEQELSDKKAEQEEEDPDEHLYDGGREEALFLGTRRPGQTRGWGR